MTRAISPRALSAFLAVSLTLLTNSAGAQGTPPKLAGVGDRIKTFIDSKEIAGAVTLVANKDGIVHLETQGLADVAENKPMTPDTIFWIASMTKPVTGAAVMMLVEQGKVAIDDPASKYIPEFADLKTKDGKAHVVTIRHLLTHTSGLADLTGAESATCSTLADVMKIAASKPLNFEPGSKWAYCQSSINAGGRIVEVVSGMPFQDFLEQKLFAPLGMKDTTFFLRDEQMPRLVKSYRRTQEGQLVEAVNRTPDGQRTKSFSKFPAANGGLFSTAPDYAKFCRMLLNKGTLDGKQYLKPESVEKMTSVLSGDVTTGFTPGNGWGLAFCVVREPQGVSAVLSPGTFGHGGAHGTQAWIDPVKGVAYVLMVQRANFPNSDASPVRQAFQEAAAQAMKK